MHGVAEDVDVLGRGDRDARRRAASRMRAQPPQDLDAVQVGQVDVEQDEVGAERVDQLHAPRVPLVVVADDVEPGQPVDELPVDARRP